MLLKNRTLREGITAGVLGATAVAVWFLILDTVAGRPFATPSMLGSSLATLFGSPGTGPASLHVLGAALVTVAAATVWTGMAPRGPVESPPTPPRPGDATPAEPPPPHGATSPNVADRPALAERN